MKEGDSTSSRRLRPPLRLTLPAPPRALIELLDAQERALLAAGLDEDCRQRARLVSEEVLSNILRHAGARRAELDMGLTADGLWLCFRDDAPAFDPRRVKSPDPTTPLSQRGPGGMGLLLVQGMAKTLRYLHEADGNRLEVLLAVGESAGDGAHAGRAPLA
jgi:anti-sigma regulatory factor (Ser/Thr protein kinase)